jgi:cell division protease FtsH
MRDEPKKTQQMFPNARTIFVVLLALLVVLYLAKGSNPTNARKISYTDFKERVHKEKVAEITVKGTSLTGILKEPEDFGPKEYPRSSKEFQTTIPSFGDPELMGLLERKGVTIKAESSDGPITGLFIGLLPWLLILGVFVFAARRMRGSAGGGGDGWLFGFGKSKAKLYRKSGDRITFDDVAGLSNAKKELAEIIDFLKDPTQYKALGGKLPKGILLAGPPGTGKTLLARAAAGEANASFYSISGSEFVEMFVGVGASRVRDMFHNAKTEAPSIIFIDEIDSIGRMRGTGLVGSHDEREQTLNQILSEMDGFSPNELVVVMAATNRPDILDPALIRPGRFDRRITLDLPQKRARKDILQIHTRGVPISDDVDLGAVADRTAGFSGADLANLVNEAVLLAARKRKQRVEAQDFDQSRDKVIMGLEREELISEPEKKVVAYHEAGHALMAKLLPGTDPLKKVTIIPRGQSLGATEQIPEEDRHNFSRSYLLNRIMIMLGGRVAEKLIYNDLTSGAGDDLRKATQIARRMVCQWGMSERLGPVAFKFNDPRDMIEQKDFSEHTARLIDEEVQKIIQGMEKRTEEILVPNRRRLDAIVDALVIHETLTNDEVDEILREVPDLPRGEIALPLANTSI